MEMETLLSILTSEKGDIIIRFHICGQYSKSFSHFHFLEQIAKFVLRVPIMSFFDSVHLCKGYLIQTRLGHKGNFEIVVPQDDRGGFAQLSTDNDNIS
jgi:hypothetical protein